MNKILRLTLARGTATAAMVALAAPADATSRANCSNSSHLYPDSSSTTCRANAGDAYPTLYGVYGLSVGNNAGYVETTGHTATPRPSRSTRRAPFRPRRSGTYISTDVMPDRRRSLSAACLPVLACLSVVAGCAGRREAPSNQVPIGPITTVRAEGDVHETIDQYLLTSKQILQLMQVRDAAISRCLDAHGTTSDLRLPDDAAAFVAGQERDRTVRSNLWGFFDTSNASRYGYERPPGVPVQLAERAPLVASSAQCYQVGDAAIGGVELTSEMTALPGRGPRQPTDDSRYVAAVGKWSACMAEAGFSYSDPIAALTDRRWAARSPAGPTTRLEIATAQADVQCKITTNLVGISVAVQDAYDNLYIRAHHSQLLDFERLLRTCLAKPTK